MTYDELRAALHAYVHREDALTTANEPTALELARVAIGREFYPRESQALTQFDVTTGQAPLVENWGQAEVVYAGDGELEAVPIREYTSIVAGSDTARKREVFAVSGVLLYAAAEHGLVHASYFMQPPAITATLENWLSVSYPDVWLHAARAEQWRYLQDYEAGDAAAAHWRRLAGEAVDSSRRNVLAGGALRMRSRRG